jgi:hypothetical protein
MTKKRQLEYILLRYVPDAVKGEFVNIGVVMLEPGANGSGFADVRFTRDWRRVRCLDPQADVEMLEGLEREIREQLADAKDRASLLKRLEDSFSNVIHLSEAKGLLADDPAAEVGTMASLYLEAARIPGQREASGRQKILGKMRDAFEQAGVWKFMAPVPVAPYTKIGDPLTFDFGYRVGGEVDEIKMFHAVSLKASVTDAVMLASRYPTIAPVLGARMGGTPLLTAVIDDYLDRGRAETGFALEMMAESGITIAVVAEMPMIAEVARMELKA